MAHKTSSHLPGIDGLRGIAALVIVVYHLFCDSDNPEWRPFFNVNVLRPLHDGWVGVNLFLVLSGFCLYWPFARNSQRAFHFGEFMERRFWRIVPAYYASLVLVPAVVWLAREAHLYSGISHSPKGLLDVILHIFLLHSLSAESIQSWNSVTWSLGLEWTWYLFFPIAVLMFRKWGPLRTLVALLLITVTYLVSAYLVVGPTNRLSEDSGLAIRSFLPGRLFEFGLGMAVAWWTARRILSPNQTRLATVCALLLLALGHIATPVDPMLPVRNLIYGAAFSLLILIAAAGVENGFSAFCERLWIRKIGGAHIVFTCSIFQQ